jgi:hypothetical protein
MKSTARSVCWIVLGLVWANSSPSALGDDNTPIAFVELVCKSSKAATPQEEDQCLKAVKLALLEKYIASLGPERKPLVTARKEELAASIDTCLDNVVTRSKQFDTKTKTLTLAAQGDINTGRINQIIDGGAAVGAEKNPIVFIFVARRQQEVESKGPKVTTGSQETKSAEKNASEQSRPGETTVAAADKSSQAVSTISSVTRTADRIVYALEDNAKAGIDRTISKVLVDRGFDVVPASELLGVSKGDFDPDKIQKDFETSSQFTLEHQRMATRVCREAGAPMLAYGTLTLGVKSIDPANGRNTIVNVIVDAVVLDCRKPLTIKVGSIGALQVNGVGADQTEAETAALDLAATKAANVLADQLRNRGIR